MIVIRATLARLAPGAVALLIGVLSLAFSSAAAFAQLDNGRGSSFGAGLSFSRPLGDGNSGTVRPWVAGNSGNGSSNAYSGFSGGGDSGIGLGIGSNGNSNLGLNSGGLSSSSVLGGLGLGRTK